MIAVLAGAALAQAFPLIRPPAAEACPGICDAHRLRPYFDKLARIERDRLTVRILQIGDSHTAGDQISGAWRAALQARYGNAGRGVLAPGRPYQGYLTKDVTAQQGPGWTVNGIFGPTWSSASTTPVGLSNFSLTALASGATLSIRADSGNFDNFQLCALTGPGAGTLTLTLGSAVRTVTLAGDRIETRCEAVEGTGPAASLTANGGPVTVTSWATGRAQPGVVLSNLGTVGAQLVHFTRTDERVVMAEAAQYRPDLLVVAFGTNEAFMPKFSSADYAARLRTGLRRMQRLFPDVPMLVLGASDSATANAALQSGESGASLACAAGDEGGGQDWRPTAALAAVQAIQRRIAHEEGAAFWDWSRAMGGRCTALAWVRAGLMRPDRVHFTTAGGAEIARRLQADMDAAAAVVSTR